MASDFKVRVGLDVVPSAEEIKKDLPRLQALLDKDSSARLKLIAELDLERTQKLIKSQLSNITNQIDIPNINIEVDVGNTNTIKQAQKSGQQIGQLISDSAQDAIENASSHIVGRFFKIDNTTSNYFKSEMQKLVDGWTDNKGQIVDVKVQTRTTYDNEAEKNITRLHQATVEYKNGLDEVIKKTIAWSKIGIDEKGNEIKGFVEVAGQYSKNLSDITTKTDTFADRQIQTISNLKNELSTIQTRFNDVNAPKHIFDEEHIKNVNNKINEVNNAIDVLGDSTKNTFVQSKTDVERLIVELNELIRIYKNAEYAATELRTKDINSIKETQQNKLSNFISQVNGSIVPYERMKDTIETLQSAINSINGEPSSLTAFLNQFDNAKSQFNSMKSLYKSIGNYSKEIDKLSSSYQKQGIYIGEIKDRIEDFKSELKTIGTADGLTSWVERFRNQIGSIGEISNITKDFDKLSKTFNSSVLKNNSSNKTVVKLKNQFVSVRKEYDDFIKKINDTPNAHSIEYIKQKYTELGNKLGSIQTEAEQLQNNLIQKVGTEKLEQNVSKLQARIEAFRASNPKAEKQFGRLFDGLLLDLKECGDNNTYQRINRQFQIMTKNIEAFGLKGDTMLGTLKKNIAKFTGWMSMTQAVSQFTGEVRKAIVELKEVDTLLTEISKANDKLSKTQLAQIGNDAFDTASKYGKKATDYLASVQEMSRAGYENAEALGELSVAAQGAGDMTADVANAFIVATDKAYKFNGSAEKLTETLDGINYITNHNAVNMSELSEGFSIVASTAASFGIKANELTAALGTMAAVTQQSGSEVARAFKAILLNIRQVSDEEEGIDAEGLTKYEAACNALGVSLKETKNGVLQTRDAMEVLKELSVEYSKLSEDDLRRTNLLNSIGGKLRSTQLDAILRNWDTYEAMLRQYAEGSGSMTSEGEKTANSLEGALNRLSNTWTDTVENILNSDTMTNGVNVLNTILNLINGITEALGLLGSVGLGLGIFAGIKNVGSPKMFGLVLICQQ